MDEWKLLIDQLNDFLRRRGLKVPYVAEQISMSTTSLYAFKCGRKLITNSQAQKIRAFIADYDARLGN